MALRRSSLYKSMLIERLGGEQDFRFIVLSLVERLQADPKLEQFFSNFDADSLFIHQQEFLNTIFANTNETDIDINSFALLRYYSLIDQGFDETHFDLVVNHFMEAMDDAWVDDQDAIKDAIQLLGSFRVIFSQQVLNNQSKNNSIQAAAAATKKETAAYYGKGMFFGGVGRKSVATKTRKSSVLVRGL